MSYVNNPSSDVCTYTDLTLEVLVMTIDALGHV